MTTTALTSTAIAHSLRAVHHASHHHSTGLATTVMHSVASAFAWKTISAFFRTSPGLAIAIGVVVIAVAAIVWWRRRAVR